MARGDTVTVKYSGPSGTETQVVEAHSIGSSVKVEEPRSADLFLSVIEVNKGGGEVMSAKFAKGVVLSVVTGAKAARKRGKAK